MSVIRLVCVTVTGTNLEKSNSAADGVVVAFDGASGDSVVVSFSATLVVVLLLFNVTLK